MRVKMLYDLAYCAAMENVWTFLSLETSIILRTPLVIIFSATRT